ncbi:BRCA and CDKN1A-interacting protein isoform C-like [Cryptosporidium canis]|uniref:BRCA and CDKN1A-interacting protein isoform C-like n=1 Tax=Cryptosporidium canis TaxID=195482 RepID=A0ABQ8P8L6_9CRYT|nr:BRCA and CDKN1A-interacting protein isoform C-like [Cryptosporidium canis]KAJ1614733.1 BRCA and CDKN1A-interacting protein isoform C-like [Cryptosporidium canis]
MSSKRKTILNDESCGCTPKLESIDDEIFFSIPEKPTLEKKTKRIESESSDEESTFDGEFEFNDPNENDYHSIKNILLMSQYSQIKGIRFHEFVDLICNQGNIGTTVSISDHVIAFSTILNFRQYKHILSKIVEYLSGVISRNKNKEFETLFNSIVYKKNVGLMINERLSNTPLEIVPILCSCLKDDIKWTVDHLYNDVPSDEREYYQWDYIVLLTARYISPDGSTIIYKKYEEEKLVINSLHTVIWQGNKKQQCGTGLEGETELMCQEFLFSIIEYNQFLKHYN